MGFVVVIPARYESSRLPGKPLADIHGKPMVQWVYEQSAASGAKQVIVATDDQRIVDAVKQFGGEVCLTDPHHQSGTERLAEVVQHYGFDEQEIIVNVQGDEPLIPPENIQQVAENLAQATACRMATLSVQIHDVAEVLNPNAVKVVTDRFGYALYFSRSVLPYSREQLTAELTTTQDNASATLQASNDLLCHQYQRHIGIYAYRAGFIQHYVSWNASPIEKIESLEQLRVLWHGEKIHVETANIAPPAGVDTPEDLASVRQLLQQK